ncbi:MAG TPA: methyltransferase domain-containing protein, partial [Myxococcota bacterium]
MHAASRFTRLWRPYGDEGPTMGELAVQAWSSTDHGYDLLARRFDHTPFRTPDDVVVKALAVVEHKTARGIDLCCGTGAGLLRLADHCEHVVGIDRSAGMLAEARRLVPRA